LGFAISIFVSGCISTKSWLEVKKSLVYKPFILVECLPFSTCQVAISKLIPTLLRFVVIIMSTATASAQSKLVKATLLCLCFMLVEVVGGYLAHSLAVLTDAAHLLSDVAGFAVRFLSKKISRPCCLSLNKKYFNMKST